MDGPLHRRLATQPLIDEPDNDLVLRGLLAAGDSDADVSVTWVQLAGHHRRLRTDASTRLYLVVAGSGTITVAEEPRAVTAGDLVVIPRSTPYHLDGAMTYLVLNRPAFQDGDDHYLEAVAEDPGQPARTAE